MAQLNNSTTTTTNNEKEKEKLALNGQTVDDLVNNLPITEDTRCGCLCISSPLLQRMANKKMYVILYGLLGLIFSASHAYFNGIITTIEKRYRIPSRTTGLITVGNDIVQLFITVILSYYGGKGHRPRWIAGGIYTVVLYCLLTALPHVIYGPGEDALALTYEYGGHAMHQTLNITNSLVDGKENRKLCNVEGGVTCDEEGGLLAPTILFFVANCVSGVGGPLYYTLGLSYMDDNIQKSKTPSLISLSYFIRMLGPAIGYTLASFCLNIYISPTLTPFITQKDPRWLGAWWLGWCILASLLFIMGCLIGLFPKVLPRAAARKMLALERELSKESDKGQEKEEEEERASLSDLLVTLKRILSNPTYMFNNLASVFYCLGYMPFWIFTAKYIEIQYRQSASFSSLVTGTVGLGFSALGILASGLVISRWKPKARTLAAWNVFVSLASVFGIVSYVFLGCAQVTVQDYTFQESGELQVNYDCNNNCNCEYVNYAPVCSLDGKSSFISACHAGCRKFGYVNGTKTYQDCSCVNGETLGKQQDVTEPSFWGTATSGPCLVDCTKEFYMFLLVVCILKFIGSSGRASNFLVSVRCVEEKDKTMSLGIGLMMASLFAFIPSPILFGYILDLTCLVWGKTCNGKGNCWLYNSESLRYMLNFTSAGFILIGTLFDCVVWYFVKSIKIFDDEEETEKKGKSMADGETQEMLPL